MIKEITNGPIPFRAQINGYACGAACLEMLFNLFDIHYSQSEILESIVAKSISTVNPYCDLTKMINYSNNIGVPCVAVVPKSPEKFIQYCHDNQLHLILMYHRNVNIPIGHYAVLSNLIGDRMYLHDPFNNSGKDKLFRLNSFPGKHMRIIQGERSNGMRYDDIGKSYTMIVLAHPAADVEPYVIQCNDCEALFPVMTTIIPYISHIVCPNEGKWKIINS